MHIAMISRPGDPVSLRIYASEMSRHAGALGAEIVRFGESEPIPAGCDVVWDPGVCMRRIPPILAKSPIPIAVTFHGAKAFALPLEEIIFEDETQEAVLLLKAGLSQDWSWLSESAGCVIAVSQYAANEARMAFGLNAERIHVVLNGLDHEIFRPTGTRCEGRYFLALSSANPIKNLDRILAAYQQLPQLERPDLVVVAPGVTNEPVIDGVSFITDEVPQQELAVWYRGATALVFPSLRETFGLPIIEAMACGCPVITSNTTGCAEVAGEAAILVDPRSVDDINTGLRRMLEDQVLRQDLIARGIEQSRPFSWKTSACRLVEIFQSLIPEQRKHAPKMRKLEVTTTASCSVACHFCPHGTYRAEYAKTRGESVMRLETFIDCLKNIPTEVDISFGGMTEPFQNPQCADMIIYAERKGHSVEVFSTLAGLSLSDLERVLAEWKPRDRFYVHLPSSGGIERLYVTDAYRSKLRRLISFGANIEFHYHGAALHEGLLDLGLKDQMNYWPIHDRAGNEAKLFRIGERKSGRIACIMNMEVNILLPDGSVLACSQDFGLKHVIGNLLKDKPADLYSSESFLSLQRGQENPQQEIMCRYCHFAVHEESVST